MRSIPPLVAVVVSLGSGFAALQYEVLWARQLRELVGGSVPAGAWVVAWFFVGLSLGAWRLGPPADRSRNPWCRFAALEICIVAVVLPTMWLDWLAGLVLPTVGDALWGPAGGAIKAALAGVVVVPPAFLMGGTLPALGAAAIVDPERAGPQRAWLYGLNTLGGAGGIACVTFATVPRIGMHRSYLLAVSCGVTVALIAWLRGRHARRPPNVGQPRAQDPCAAGDDPPSLPQQASSSASPPSVYSSKRIGVGVTLPLAAISGYAVLAAEVLVLIALPQVYTSTTFCFGAIVLVVVLMLGLSALALPLLVGRLGGLHNLLVLALPCAGLGAAAFPMLFLGVTNNLEAATADGRLAYILGLVGVTVITAGPLFAFAGLVLPAVFALDAREAETGSTGWSLLLAANAAGAILGAWSAGAVLMPALGLWRGFAAVGLLYAAGATLIAVSAPRRLRPARVACAIGAIVVLAVLATSGRVLFGGLPLLQLEEDERLLEVRQGREGVAAIADHGSLTLRLNNYYWLGGTDALAIRHQRRMGLLPLMLHPAPRHIAHVGLGMGVTAGAPLSDPEVERLTALELSPLVATLAKRHLSTQASGLFGDPRARVIIEDGRTFLRARPESFDIVTADLFTPWRSGVGSAYSVEHFRTVRKSLRRGGLFCQWLPAYQLDVATLRVILATFEHVFPGGVLLHGSLDPDGPTLGLLGFRDHPYPYAVLTLRCDRARRENWTHDPFLRHALGAAMLMIGRVYRLTDQNAPLNTLDNGWVEFHAPVVDIAPDEVFLYDWKFGSRVASLQAEARTRRDLRTSWLRGAPPDAHRALLAGIAFYNWRCARIDESVDDAQFLAFEQELNLVLPSEVSQDPYWPQL